MSPDQEVWWGVCDCYAWPVVMPDAMARRLRCSLCDSILSIFPPREGEFVKAHPL